MIAGKFLVSVIDVGNFELACVIKDIISKIKKRRQGEPCCGLDLLRPLSREDRPASLKFLFGEDGWIRNPDKVFQDFMPDDR